MYFILILISFGFALSCSDMWKLLLHTEEMMDCQTSGRPGGRGLLLFWGGCFSLFIENFDLQLCGLQRNTRTLSSAPFQHSSWSLQWIVAWKSLNAVLVIQWYELVTSLGWDWEGWSPFLPFLAATDGALPVRGQGLECPGSAALGSGSWALSPVCAVSVLAMSVLGCRWTWA